MTGANADQAPDAKSIQIACLKTVFETHGINGLIDLIFSAIYVVGQHVGPSEHNDLLAQTLVQKVEEIFRGGIEDPVVPGCEGAVH
jgi:hypothetical protein